MNIRNQGIADTDSLVKDAVSLLDESNAYQLLSSAEIGYARQATLTLTQWQAYTSSATAAILARVLQTGRYPEAELVTRFGVEAVTLASKYVSWMRAADTDVRNDSDANVTRYSQLLRSLLHQAYLDDAGLPFIYLVLADHDAQISDPQASEASAHLCRAVYIPLAEMLGLWSIRRQWLTRCFRILAPEDCKELEKQLLRRGESDKAETFAHFRSTLLAAFRQMELSATPRIVRYQEMIGSILIREEGGGARDDLPLQLRVRIFCQSIDDCYRALGAVHSLGRPVTTKFSEGFDDYISAPKPNGYQALHTSLLYEFTRADQRKGLKSIKVCIFTPEMHRRNEWGALARRYYRSSPPHTMPAWWQQLDHEEESSTNTQEFNHIVALRDLMRGAPSGVCPLHIYAFTPMGQAIILPEGSTSLDFAYHIHTEVGHHAARIEVNGLVVPHGQKLHNGDLIRVRHDPHFEGPDLSWLRFVNTGLARSRVRTGLLRRAKRISHGRLLVEQALIRLIEYFRDERRYSLELTSGLFDAFLYRIVRLRRLPDINALYQAIASGTLSADKLARGLYSEELAAVLVNPSGEPIKYPLHRIVLCDTCKPVPGDPILALERRAGTSTKGVVVHRENCLVAAKSTKVSVSTLTWSSSRSTQQLLVEYEISAGNRYRLVGDILDLIYTEPGVHLHKIQAQEFSGRPAHVVMTLEVAGPEQISRLHSQLELVKGVVQVFSYPVSQGEKAFFTSSPFIRGVNPYDESAVFQRYSFYDREDQAASVSSWLTEPAPARVMILHGQRRVGKSALARFLTREVVPQKGLAKSVYIDLQGLSTFEPIGFAQYLAGAVYEALGSTVPPMQAQEEPVLWLNRVLRAAVEKLGGTRLLIVLDEFNYLLDLEQDGKVDPVLFYNLRAVLGESRDINWLMIVQDVRFKDTSSWGSAGPLFQQAVPLHVPNLDSHWARKLILEPAGQAGFTYEGKSDSDRSKDVAAVAFDLTAGNPYLIQALCRNMLDCASKQKRDNVTMGDLKFAMNLVLSEGSRYFDHFLRHLNDPRYLAIVKAVARNSQPTGDWAKRAQIVRALSRHKVQTASEELDTAIARLARVGILEIRTDLGSVELRIAVPIFHDWMSKYLT